MIINCPVCGKEVEVKAYRETYVSDWNKKNILTLMAIINVGGKIQIG